MYLLLSDLQSSFCERVRALLVQKGNEVRIISQVMRKPLRFVWQFDNLRSNSRLVFEDGAILSDKEIQGVLVRMPGRAARDFWEPEDIPYLDEEAHAALFGWLWSLDCPVVNRCPPAFWFCPGAPVHFWQRILECSGLQAADFLLTNVEEEGRVFDAGAGGRSIVMPLTYAARQLPSLPDELSKNILLDLMPLHLTQDSAELRRVCVVGSHVIWDGPASSGAEVLESSLKQCSALSGLPFLELTIASSADGARVVAVDPYPGLESFGAAAQREIITLVVELLTGALGTV
jgi:hypothetical protein